MATTNIPGTINGQSAVIAPDGSDILSFDASTILHVEVDGAVLAGINVLDGASELEFSETSQLAAFWLRAADGQVVLVKHMDGAVPAGQRIYVAGLEADAYMTDNDHVFMLVYDSGLAAWKLRANAWIPVSPAQPPQVFGSTSDPTRSSASWATIEEMTLAITPSNGWIDLQFEGTFFLDPPAIGDTVAGQVRLAVNGSPVAGSTRSMLEHAASLVSLTPGDRYANVCTPNIRITGLTPGVPVTCTAEWSVTSGTITAVGVERSLRAYTAMS